MHLTTVQEQVVDVEDLYAVKVVAVGRGLLLNRFHIYLPIYLELVL